jgi:vitamin B12 transporter
MNPLFSGVRRLFFASILAALFGFFLHRQKATSVRARVYSCRKTTLWRALAPAALALIASVALAANRSTICGTITDPTGAAVSGARVDLLRGGKAIASAGTNRFGSYEFSNALPGHYKIRAQAPGFAPRSSDLFYAGADLATANLALQLGSVSQQIVVTATGTRVPESQVGASVTVLSSDQFPHRLDVLAPLEHVPGAQLVQSGPRGAATSLFMRGGNSNANKVLLDGAPMNDVGGVVNFGTIATTGIEQVEVLRGPNSVLYGPDAMAGVVSLTTRRGTTPLPEASYSLDGGNFSTTHQDASLAGVFRRLDYLGEFSREDTGNALPNSRFHNGTYVANAGLALNSATDLRVIGRYTTTGLGQPNTIEFFGIPDDSSQRDQDAYLSAALQNQTTPRWHNLLRYSGTRLRLQDANPSPTGIPDPFGNFLGQPVTIHGANGFNVTGQAILDFGGVYPVETSSSTKRDTAYLQSDYSFSPKLTGLLAFRFEQERGFTLGFGSKTEANRDNSSYIAEVHGSLGSRAYATLGGSVEKNAIFGVTALPRLSLAYYLLHPNSNGTFSGTKVKANYGQGIKEPSIFETSNSLFGLLSEPGGAPQLIPQFNIGPIAAERSRSYDVGVEQLVAGGKMKLSVTYYHNQFTNQIEFVPSTALPLLGVPQSVVSAAGFGATINSGDTRAQGVETELEAGLGHGFFVRAGYTYLDAVVVRSFTNDAFSCDSPAPQPTCFNPAFRGIPIGAFAPLVGSRPFRRAPHTASFSIDYSRHKLELMLTGYIVSRRDDSTFLSDDSTFGTGMLLPNHDLAPAFQKIDFGGSYHLNDHLAVYTSLENLASQHYDPVFGFRALPFTARIGIKLTLGGESWRL